MEIIQIRMKHLKMRTAVQPNEEKTMREKTAKIQWKSVKIKMGIILFVFVYLASCILLSPTQVQASTKKLGGALSGMTFDDGYKETSKMKLSNGAQAVEWVVGSRPKDISKAGWIKYVVHNKKTNKDVDLYVRYDIKAASNYYDGNNSQINLSNDPTWEYHNLIYAGCAYNAKKANTSDSFVLKSADLYSDRHSGTVTTDSEGHVRWNTASELNDATAGQIWAGTAKPITIVLNRDQNEEARTNEDGVIDTTTDGFNDYKEAETEDPDDQDSLLQKAAAKLFNFLLTPIWALNNAIVDWLTVGISEGFRLHPRPENGIEDPNNPSFVGMVATMAKRSLQSSQVYYFFNAFRIVALTFLAFDMIIGLYLCMVKQDSNDDSPLNIVFRGVAGTGLIMLIYPLLDRVIWLFFGRNSGMQAFFIPGNGVTIDPDALKSLTNVDLSGHLNATADNLPIINNLFMIVLQVSLILTLLRLYLEIIERWLLCNLMYIMAPLAMAMLPSKSTSGITSKFIRSFIAECLIMVFNTWLVQLAIIMLNNYSSDANPWKNLNDGYGGNLVYILVVIGILLAATKIDDYLNNMGLSALKTGMGLASAVMGAVGSTVAITRAGAGLAKAGWSAGKAAVSMTTGKALYATTGTGKGPNILSSMTRSGHKVDKAMNNVGRAEPKNNAIVFGEAKRGLTPEEYQRRGGKSHVLTGRTAADFLAKTTGNEKGQKWKWDKGTTYNPVTGEGHAVGIVGGKKVSGNISKRPGQDAVDIGGGLFLRQDNGDKHIGGELDKGMYKGEVRQIGTYNNMNSNLSKEEKAALKQESEQTSIPNYNETHYNALNQDNLRAIGAENATHVRSEGNGEISLFHYDKDGNEVVDAGLSYSPETYGNTEPLKYQKQTEDHNIGDPVKINGNTVYGLVNGENGEQKLNNSEEGLQEAAYNLAEKLNQDDKTNSWKAIYGKDDSGKYLVENEKKGEQYKIQKPIGTYQKGTSVMEIKNPGDNESSAKGQYIRIQHSQMRDSKNHGSFSEDTNKSARSITTPRTEPSSSASPLPTQGQTLNSSSIPKPTPANSPISIPTNNAASQTPANSLPKTASESSGMNGTSYQGSRDSYRDGNRGKEKPIKYDTAGKPVPTSRSKGTKKMK